MRNRVQNGKSINVTLAAVIVSGRARQIGDMLGVASVDGAVGENIAFRVQEVFRFPKAAVAISAGDVVNYDESADQITTAATAAAGDVTGCGVAFETRAGGDGDIAVLLTPGTGVGS